MGTGFDGSRNQCNTLGALYTLTLVSVKLPPSAMSEASLTVSLATARFSDMFVIIPTVGVPEK